MRSNVLQTAALALLALGTAEAVDWIPGEAGDRQHYTRTVQPSFVAIAGVENGEEVQARVVHRQGGWRLWSDFVGLGPRWVHSGQGDQLYLYDGLQAQLLIDFAKSAGHSQSPQVLTLSDGVRIEAWQRYTNTEVTTRAGTYTCTEVLLTVYNPDNTREQRTLFVSPEVGVVRWRDDKNPYDYNVYYQPVYVQHDLDPSPLNTGAIALSGAVDAVRVGDRAFVARGAAGLSQVDLRSGQVERTLQIPAQRVHRNGSSVVVHGQNASGVTEVYQIGDAGPALRLPFAHPVVPSRDGGIWGSSVKLRFLHLQANRFESFDDQGNSLGSVTFTGSPAAGRYTGSRGAWGRHYVPLSSGGVLALEAAQPYGNVTEAPFAVHGVQPFNEELVVAGPSGLYLRTYGSRTTPTHLYTPWLSEAVGQITVRENRLWALTASAIVEFNDQGQELSRSALTGLPDMTSLRHGLLDVQRGKALLLVADEGLRVVER